MFDVSCYSGHRKSFAFRHPPPRLADESVTTAEDGTADATNVNVPLTAPRSPSMIRNSRLLEPLAACAFPRLIGGSTDADVILTHDSLKSFRAVAELVLDTLDGHHLS